MRYWNYFKMLNKRLLKKPAFLLILLLMPLFSFCVMHFSTTEKSGLRIAICNSGEDPLSSSMEQYLTGLSGLVQFESYDSVEEVYEQVRYRNSDCGYIFPPDLTERLEKGVSLGAIEAVVSPGTTMLSFANEFIIMAFMRTYAYDLLLDSTINSNDFAHLSKEDITSELRDYYKGYLSGDETFSFAYKNESNEPVADIQIIPDFLIHSAYGIGALFLFIGALAGAIVTYKDKKDGVFSIFPPFQNAMLQYMDVFVPAFLCGIAAWLNCLILETSVNPVLELFRVVAFVLLCTGCCFLLHLFVPSAVVFSSFLPVFIIGSMLFCPVFVDISALIPKLTTAKYLFLPTYYLSSRTFLSSAVLALCGMAVSAVSILLCFRTEKKF